MGAEIIAVFGADHKCGVTMLSQCASEMLSARFPKKRVLLLHAGEGGGEYCLNVRESFEHIGPYIQERSLDIPEICERSHVNENLYVIGGISDIRKTSSFYPDMTVYFLDAVRDLFDYIVCDCGSELRSGLSLGALLSAKKLLVVLTQSKTALSRYERFLPLYDKLGLKADVLALNMYEKRAACTPGYIEKRLGLPKGSLVPVRKSQNGEASEIEGKSLLRYKDSLFSKDIEKLSESLVER